MAGQTNGFMAHTFHQITIGGDDIGVMVYDIVSKSSIEQALGERHSNRRRQPLAQRTRGCFNTVCVAIFWVAGCFCAELAKVFKVVDRHILIAEQIMQGILQHRPMARREDKAIAIGPLRM